jgi:hypothetical protein
LAEETASSGTPFLLNFTLRERSSDRSNYPVSTFKPQKSEIPAPVSTFKSQKKKIPAPMSTFKKEK